jgi:hypothetical protein
MGSGASRFEAAPHQIKTTALDLAVRNRHHHAILPAPRRRLRALERAISEARVPPPADALAAASLHPLQPDPGAPEMLYASAVPIPPLPAAALRDLLGIVRVLWWVRWAAGADENELRAIASVGDDVLRLVRASRFEGCVERWHQARLAMSSVVRVGEVVPWADVLLRAGARRVLAVPGIPPPPRHAFAAPGTELPDESA